MEDGLVKTRTIKELAQGLVRKTAYSAGTLAVGTTAIYATAKFIAIMNYGMDVYGLNAAIEYSPHAAMGSISAGLAFTKGHLNELLSATALTTGAWAAVMHEPIRDVESERRLQDETPLNIAHCTASSDCDDFTRS